MPRNPSIVSTERGTMANAITIKEVKGYALVWMRQVKNFVS